MRSSESTNNLPWIHFLRFPKPEDGWRYVFIRLGVIAFFSLWSMQGRWAGAWIGRLSCLWRQVTTAVLGLRVSRPRVRWAVVFE